MPKRTLEVTLPQMGESVTEGVVGTWRKRVGDQVSAGETLVEIQTDKIDAEVPAPESGRLSRILADEGETVAVGGGLAEIELGQTGNGQAPPTAAIEPSRGSAPEGDAPLEAELIPVPLPQMGESVTDGIVGRWHKQVGDQVNAGETLVEIQTEKVDAEVPSPVTGVVSEILVAEGETTTVGTVLARVKGSVGPVQPRQPRALRPRCPRLDPGPSPLVPRALRRLWPGGAPPWPARTYEMWSGVARAA